MQIDDVMALVDEYVSASIEDHGYRSGAASAEYLEDTKRKLLAAIESLIAAPAAPVQQAEPVAWAVSDSSGEVIYAALFKTRCVEYRDNEYRYGHSAAKNWVVRPVFQHPPAAELQRLREAAKRVIAAQSGSAFAVNESINELRRALEGE